MTSRLVTVGLRASNIRIPLKAVEGMAIAVAQDDGMAVIENSANAQSLSRLHRAIRRAEQKQGRGDA